jgi:hypothetical protein
MDVIHARTRDMGEGDQYISRSFRLQVVSLNRISAAWSSGELTLGWRIQSRLAMANPLSAGLATP